MGVCYTGDYPKDIECAYHNMKGYIDELSINFICECIHPIAKTEYHDKSCFNEGIIGEPLANCPYFKQK